MDERRLRDFINLVSFDQNMHAMRAEISNLKNQIESLAEQKKCYKDDLQVSNMALHDLRKKVDQHELTMHTLEQRENEIKAKIDSATQAKEYSALKTELQHVRQKQQDLESELIDAWEQLDTAMQKLKGLEIETEKKTSDVDVSINDVTIKLSDLEKQINQVSSEREGLTALVSPELIDMYEHMSGRVANPVVPVDRGSCSACFYSISVQDLHELATGSLLPCRSCYRILYMPDVKDESSEESKSVKSS